VLRKQRAAPECDDFRSLGPLEHSGRRIKWPGLRVLDQHCFHQVATVLKVMANTQVRCARDSFRHYLAPLEASVLGALALRTGPLMRNWHQAAPLRIKQADQMAGEPTVPCKSHHHY
jgi:hypothetical protein